MVHNAVSQIYWGRERKSMSVFKLLGMELFRTQTFTKVVNYSRLKVVLKSRHIQSGMSVLLWGRMWFLCLHSRRGFLCWFGAWGRRAWSICSRNAPLFRWAMCSCIPVDQNVSLDPNARQKHKSFSFSVWFCVQTRCWMQRNALEGGKAAVECCSQGASQGFIVGERKPMNSVA